MTPHRILNGCQKSERLQTHAYRVGRVGERGSARRKNAQRHLRHHKRTNGSVPRALMIS